MSPSQSQPPRIFVFCNNCSHEWHEFTALSEDGAFLAGHICSSHSFGPHDMGMREDGWKRDTYAKYYPEGFVVELVESPKTHEGVQAAYARHKAYTEEEYAAKIAPLQPLPLPKVEVTLSSEVNQ